MPVLPVCRRAGVGAWARYELGPSVRCTRCLRLHIVRNQRRACTECRLVAWVAWQTTPPEEGFRTSAVARCGMWELGARSSLSRANQRPPLVLRAHGQIAGASGQPIAPIASRRKSASGTVPDSTHNRGDHEISTAREARDARRPAGNRGLYRSHSTRIQQQAISPIPHLHVSEVRGPVYSQRVDRTCHTPTGSGLNPMRAGSADQRAWAHDAYRPVSHRRHSSRPLCLTPAHVRSLMRASEGCVLLGSQCLKLRMPLVARLGPGCRTPSLSGRLNV